MTTSHILTGRKVGTVFEQVAALHSTPATKQYIEAALIAKLSGRAALPAPVALFDIVVNDRIASVHYSMQGRLKSCDKLYTEDQMREAFAQGAAYIRNLKEPK